MASISGVGLFFVFLVPLVACSEIENKLNVVQDGLKDWIECYNTVESSSCLEERTARQVHEVTTILKNDVFQYFVESKRLGKNIKEDESDYTTEEREEIEKLEKENAGIAEKIKSRDSKPNGIVDEISDLFTYGVAKLFGYFAPGKQSEEELTEQIVQASEGKTSVEGRGHKKKYLKKQNKHLKIILLMMLFKNKVKMFMQKIQVLMQLKFLGIAVANLLVNVFRLWLDLKKKKPYKVVYYENAHHQHHYDHEHIHDEGHSPGHGHYSHHHEEEYGGGPWPWSRSYIEKQSDDAFQAVNTHNKPNLAAHNMVYMKSRPTR